MKRWISLLLPLAGGLWLSLLAQQPAKPPSTKGGAVKSKSGGGAVAAAKKPTASASAPADESAGSVDLSLGLRFAPPRPIRPPAAELFKLPNGLRVLVAENHEIPTVNVVAMVRAGSVHDPARQSGLAQVTAAVLRAGGTRALTAAELDDRLLQWGATLDAAALESRSQLTMQVPASALPPAMAVFRDLLTAPRLDPEAVDTMLGRVRDAIGQRNTNQAALVNRLFRLRLYEPGSAFGRQADYESVDAIGRPEIEEFHRRYFTPSLTVLAVEGDITVPAARTLVEGLFGAWPAPAGAAPPAIEAPKAAAPGFQFADRNDLRLSAIAMGHPAGRTSDPDYPAMLVACELLGSGPDSRLAARVREAGGWRAEWNVSWDAGQDRPGEFNLRGMVEAPYTTQTIQIVRDELAKLRGGQVPERELETARTRLLTRLALRSQSTADQLAERAALELFGQPPDLPQRIYQGLATASKAEVALAAARNFQAEQTVVVAGNSGLFDKPIGTIAPKVEPVELIVPGVAVAKSRVDPASLERGRAVLARLQEALGGKARLEAIKDLSIRFEGTTLMGETPTAIKLWDRWLDGDIYRQDMETTGTRRSVFYNGKIGWIGMPGSVAPLPAGILNQIRGEMFRLPFRLALSDQAPGRQVADLGGHVLQITEGEKQNMRIYLDPDSGLPQRLVYRTDFGNGLNVAVEELWSDWKVYDGIKWPAKVIVKRNGRRADELAVVEAHFNLSLKAADMEKKP